MPICKSCGKKYIYLSLGNSNYCENCEPREVIYTDEEFNNTVKGIKRKRQKSINTNPNKSKNSEKSGFYILFPLQVFLIPFVVIFLIVASYRDDYNAKLRESKKGDFKVSLESYSPEVQAILKKSFEESKDK
ncbi:hypothetical protein [Arcobacter porcinus]|uniref:Uncharacterized protein n=1 Tax=Arcobacter porcinus TaxID=1935204 RepID=A0A5C2HE06_9BACT|nr:hypothetical protein [Arcobacter porcinus]OCL96564.1 hypothetical protein AAX27_00614 [Aliarcobacter thereius]QEP41186.1 hypothetical protein APORC_1614 [Arcobacter porcinus]